MKNDELKEYYCSKHGAYGNPNCKECWDKLMQFGKDYNVNVVGVDDKK